MIKIAKNRLEAINWVHEQLNYVPRPLAEQTYVGMLARDLIVEADDSVSLTQPMQASDVMKVAKEEHITRDNTRRARMSRRRHSSTYRQQHKTMQLKQGNSVDCIDGEVAPEGDL